MPLVLLADPAQDSSDSPVRALSEAVADLQMELARRDAEIAHLHSMLAQATTASEQAQPGVLAPPAAAYEQVPPCCRTDMTCTLF